MKYRVPVLALTAVALATPLAGQNSSVAAVRPWLIEGRAGAVVPTFDIADVAKTGGAFGATLGRWVGPRWLVMGEFDYGMHKDKATGQVDINTLHFMAKLGYSLTGPRSRGWEATVNLGAGAVTFDVDGGDRFTYFAINAGAKLAYNFSSRFALVLSPQGDIAFTDESELSTSNAWVWPFTAGVRVRF
jgi:hypothetical protein